MEWKREDFVLTDALERVDVRRVFEMLEPTYWGVRRPYKAVEQMVKNSLCFTLLHSNYQVGFGRAVTDYITFAWIADIVIDQRYRGHGLGQWMMRCVTNHPALRGTQMALQTRDAHGLYEKFGFSQSAALMSTTVTGL